MELDHVLFAVAEPAAAAEEFESRYGLGSVPGGRHDGWGTANRIVPLGDAYLELVAVVEQDEAARSVFGRWVAGGHLGRPLGWAVRTVRLDAIAQRLNLTVSPGSRPISGGGLLRWRMAGIEQAAAEPMLPFFIERVPGAAFPGRAVVRHRAGATRITQVIVEGDLGRISRWLGSHSLPILVRPGSPALAQIVLATAAGPLVLGADSSRPSRGLS
jgi:Glyoxalase-like domain